MFSVTISEKGGQQSKHDFAKSEITIGRMKGNDIVLPKSNVSKQHTRISLRDEGFFVVDLKSTNGTYVNGRKVTMEQPIGSTDKIYIGDFILQLEKAAQRAAGGPPQPPRPPQPGPAGPSPTGGGGGGNKRHFPTVMDGPSGDPNSRTGAVPKRGSAAMPSQPQPPQRQPSAAGASMNPPIQQGQDPEHTPIPNNQDDLRKTTGDPGPPMNFGADLEPLNTPGTGANSQPSQPAGREPHPTPVPSPSSPGSSSGISRPSPGPANATPSGPISSPMMPASDRAGSLGVRALAAQKPLESEFDESFHRAQQDVARVFFETISADQLPLDYPLAEGADRTRLEKAVNDAINTVSPQVDRNTLTEAVIKEVLGLGALEDYLDDETVQSIYINAHDRIVLRRDGNLVVARRAYGHPALLDVAARRLLGPQDMVPVSDEVRFSDGTRVHILMPPLAVDGPVLTVRKPNQYFPDLATLAEEGAMSAGMAEFLEHAVEAGRSIVIAGPTSSGKSTLLAALTGVVPPSTRLIAVEQHSNLPLNAPTFIRLEANPSSGFDMRFLLSNAVSMHPERIVLDECRGAEAYEWVTAAASGTEGSMLTLHGTSATDALGRLESMCLLGAADISPRGLREQVARSVDLVVILNTTADGSFRVHQIAEVQGVDLDAFRLNDLFYYRVEGTAGDYHPTGYIPLFYEDLRHAGFDVDLDIFRE